MARLCKPIRFADGTVVIPLYSTEHDTELLKRRQRLPHAELIPYMQAAREKQDQYDIWLSTWDDPVI